MFGRESEAEYAAYVESELSAVEYELLTARQWADHVDQPQVEWIPSDLEKMTPGPDLAAILSGLDPCQLSGYDLVAVLCAQQRQISHDQARLYAVMVEVSHRMDPESGWRDEAVEFASDEIRTALTLTRRAADSELGLATDLKERLPTLWAALDAGDIDLRRAKTIVYGISHLPEGTARRIVERVVEQAAKLTTGQLAARIRRLCVETDPDDAKPRYQQGVEERRMVAEANPDGTASLLGYQLPINRVTAASQRVNRLARTLKTRGETRTLDQIRADVFLDLLQGGDLKTGSADGTVDIHFELTTLARLDDHPAELAGMGPVIADIARQVAADQNHSRWTYTVTDNGEPVATGTTRKRPTAAIKRQVHARYPTCIFPGCRMPATNCDLDHRKPWAQGGPTNTDHLAPACRHDHILRDHGWQLQRLENGDHQYTSPLGHTYTTSRAPP